jgi:mRNA interferase MazF
MPTTIGFDFGDIVLVPFPFTDQTATKRRPAVVVSSTAYHQQRPDVILMAVTSQVRSPAGFGEMDIEHWQKAGLLKPAVVKPVMATVEKRLVLRKLGKLEETDRKNLLDVLQQIIG